MDWKLIDILSQAKPATYVGFAPVIAKIVEELKIKPKTHVVMELQRHSTRNDQFSGQLWMLTLLLLSLQS